MEIQQKDNETTSITSKQQQSNVLLNMTLQQSAFLLKALGMYPQSYPKYMKRTPQISG